MNPHNLSCTAALSNLEAVLSTLPPFTAKVVAGLINRGRLEQALKLVQQRQAEEQAAEKPSTPPLFEEAPPKSAGLLIAEALRAGPEPHPLPCPVDDDPRWQACKAKAVQRIKLKSGNRLPFKTYNPRHGERPGPGAFVALLLALMLYYRESDAVQRFPIFAVQWALADVLGVSTDTLQRWQQLPEVGRWVQSWRFLDAGSDYKRAGMLYTVQWNPDHRQRPPARDLLRLPLRALKLAAAYGLTQKKAERLHRITLKDRWNWIQPLNQTALSHYLSQKCVKYVTAQELQTSRQAWARGLVAALQRHLGLGDDPAVRQKFYWKLTLQLLHAPHDGRRESLLLLRRALGETMDLAGERRLRNPGAYFARRLQALGFWNLALYPALRTRAYQVCKA